MEPVADLREDALAAGEVFEPGVPVGLALNGDVSGIGGGKDGLPIILGNDPNVLDDEGLGSRLLSLCEGIVGPGIVKKVAFRDSSKDFQ